MIDEQLAAARPRTQIRTWIRIVIDIIIDVDVMTTGTVAY